MVPEFPGIGMGSQKWFATVSDNIPKPSIGKVGNIDDHPQLIHKMNAFNSLILESQFPEVLIFIGVSKVVFIVPGKSDEPYSHIIDLPKLVHITHNRLSTLQGQDA